MAEYNGKKYQTGSIVSVLGKFPAYFKEAHTGKFTQDDGMFVYRFVLNFQGKQEVVGERCSAKKSAKHSAFLKALDIIGALEKVQRILENDSDTLTTPAQCLNEYATQIRQPVEWQKENFRLSTTFNGRLYRFPYSLSDLSLQKHVLSLSILEYEAFSNEIALKFLNICKPERTFRLGEKVDFEESEEIEFKSSMNRSNKPLAAYLVGFLNKTGNGRIYFGIKDDGTVIGIPTSQSIRDKIGRMIGISTARIQPKNFVIRYNYIKVVSSLDTNDSDLFVVVLQIARSNDKNMGGSGSSSGGNDSGNEEKQLLYRFRDQIYQRIGTATMLISIDPLSSFDIYSLKNEFSIDYLKRCATLAATYRLMERDEAMTLLHSLLQSTRHEIELYLKRKCLAGNNTNVCIDDDEDVISKLLSVLLNDEIIDVSDQIAELSPYLQVLLNFLFQVKSAIIA